MYLEKIDELLDYSVAINGPQGISMESQVSIMQHYILIFDQLLNSITGQPPPRNDSPTAFEGSVNRPSPSFKISCFQNKAIKVQNRV